MLDTLKDFKYYEFSLKKTDLSQEVSLTILGKTCEFTSLVGCDEVLMKSKAGTQVIGIGTFKGTIEDAMNFWISEEK